MTDDTVTQLLAGQAKCEEQNDRISIRVDAIQGRLDTFTGRFDDLVDLSNEHAIDRKRLETLFEEIESKAPVADVKELQTAQKADDDARKGAATTWKVLRIIGAIASVLILTPAGFLVRAAWDDYGDI